jgi:hypothetical protein
MRWDCREHVLALQLQAMLNPARANAPRVAGRD